MTQQAKTPINTFVHDFPFIDMFSVFVNTSDSKSYALELAIDHTDSAMTNTHM